MSIEGRDKEVTAGEVAATALYEAISAGVTQVTKNSNWNIAQQSSTLKELAQAYRLVNGGPQATTITTK